MCERTISNLDRLKMTVKSPNSVAYFKLETTVSAVYCLNNFTGRKLTNFKVKTLVSQVSKLRPRKKTICPRSRPVLVTKSDKNLMVPILWATQLHRLLPFFLTPCFHNCTPPFWMKLFCLTGLPFCFLALGS